MNLPTNEAESARQAIGKVRESLDTICAVMDEIQKEGMTVQFHLGKDSFGRNVVAAITIIKVIA